MCMTGINVDDLHSYVYVSEDYGENWNKIENGMPDEPVNVIVEDPTNENILYVGGLRGVYISINRGNSWAYLGKGMPQTAIADMEIHIPTMDLVVATHGRGIYRTNLKPIQKMLTQKVWNTNDTFFEMDILKRPWFNSNGKDPDYRTVEKATISFWMKEAKPVVISISDKTNKEIWSINIKGEAGFNQFRWDLILTKRSSDEPYFVNYNQFIAAGEYTITVILGNVKYDQPLIVENGKSPYINK